MFGYGQESPGKPRIKKSHAYLSCLRTSAYLFPRKSISHDFCRAMFLTQREIKVQASCSSCLGQLFSKIFNFFCVPLTLPVWLLNAWVCACLDMVRNHQGNRTQKKSHAYLSCLRISAYLFPRKSISHDFCRAMFLTQREIKSASKLQQLPWTAAFEDLQLLLRSADAPGLTP